MDSVSSKYSKLLILVAGTIISGCANSIFTKYQDNQCVSNCDGEFSEPKKFEQPVLQTFQMFVGESFCWVILSFVKMTLRAGYHKIDGEADGDVAMTFKESLILAIPACCDIAGTTLMHIGLLFTPVSVYQMTRGSLVLFVATFSVIFLKRVITRYEWGSLIIVTIGVGLVGFSSSSIEADVSSELISSKVTLGIFLIILGQVFSASQFVIEEHILSKVHIAPLKLVGYEGVFGGTITFTIMILTYITIGSTIEGHKGPFDMVNALTQLFSSSAMILSSIAIMLSICAFNFFGTSITSCLSATSRSTVDTCRTLLVWLVSMCLGWESFKFLQLIARSIGIYLSGALYAIGFWVLVDASIFSKTVNASVVHVTITDWIPAICSSLGMLIVNSIEKSNLLNNNDSFASSPSTQWHARIILFMGFSLLAVGFAGSFVVLILKYLVKNFNTFPTVWMGLANVVSNGCVMLSCIVLWVVQNIEDDSFNYSLSL
ncbi:hypothetical protein PACTADRAFT_14681 [Pachysolen tannophilus NRRL Y-2460]|uniref:EamA domain-containing protein n=1 Tax=Pachysolen tannophilus NRRL Y-2460 TaxID=669874 RepID=A0A1E4U2I3_PACTA|nr:hypothetical protein PACTADRAFT_14681 [Pachysolen tannophilus NRRL Y-2460]